MSNKPFEEMDFSEKIDWATGYLTLAIGRGDFRGAVNLILQQAETAGYRRGYSSGQEAALNAPSKEGEVVQFRMGKEKTITNFVMLPDLELFRVNENVRVVRQFKA